MNGSNGIRLKVAPVQLKSKAAEVSEAIGAMIREFDELARIVDRTSHYWIGDAGDLYRRLYEEDKKDIELMLRRLKEHPSDLLQMAQLYEETEARVTEISNALPEEIIS